MKKTLLLISFILSFLISFGQPRDIIRSSQANNVYDMRGGQKLNEYIPRYTDTTQANLPYNLGVDSCGAIIYTYTGNTLWLRACSPKRWVTAVGSFSITSFNFLTDSSLVICYSSGVCDTLSMTNNAFVTINSFNNSPYFVYDSTCNCWVVDSSRVVTSTQLTNSPYFVYDSTCNCWVVDSSRVATVNYVDSSISIVNTGTCYGTLPNGNIVTWSGTGLKFYITGGDFFIGCRRYTGLPDSVTLNPADPTNPRFDVIYRDTLGAVGVLEGVAASPPLIRQVDQSYQLSLTAILVLAGDTIPANVTDCYDVYDENLQVAGGEWNSLATNISVDPDQTPIASNLTHSTYFNNIEALGVGYYVSQDVPVSVDAVLRFKILFSTFGNTFGNSEPIISFGLTKNNFSFPYNPLNYSTYIKHGQNGFDSTNKTTWQPIAVPISQFKFNGWGSSPDSIGVISISALADTAGGNPGATWYIDEVKIQCGLNQGGVPPGNFLTDVYSTPGLSADTLWKVRGVDTSQFYINDRQCGIFSPGTVFWDSLLVFSVSPSVYRLCCDGVRRTSTLASLTLSPADPSNPRYDAIVLDSTGAIVVEGTASATPLFPQLTSCQLLLTYIYIPAGSTVPGDGGNGCGLPATETIYDQTGGSEWTPSAAIVTVNFSNTNNPQHLTIAADVGAFSTFGSAFSFTRGSTINLTQYSAIKFFIRLKSNFNNNTYIGTRFLNSATSQGSATVPIQGGQFNFVRNSTGVYQEITIPMSFFINGALTTVVDRLTFFLYGSNAQGFYIDYIQLQEGVCQPPVINNPNGFGKAQTVSGAATSTTSNDVLQVVGTGNTTVSATGKTLTINSTGGSTINITSDTTFTICSSAIIPVCDTFVVNSVGVIQTITVANDTTLVICGTTPPCDTLIITSTSFAFNGFGIVNTANGAATSTVPNDSLQVVGTGSVSVSATGKILTIHGTSVDSTIVNIFYTDTTLIICYTDACDTISISNYTIVNFQTVYVQGDTALVICDSLGACQTIIINGGGTVGVDRGFFDPPQIASPSQTTTHDANRNVFQVINLSGMNWKSGVSGNVTTVGITDSTGAFLNTVTSNRNYLFRTSADNGLSDIMTSALDGTSGKTAQFYKDSLMLGSIASTVLDQTKPIIKFMNDSILVKNIAVGLSTDSVMVWNATTGKWGYRNASSFGTSVSGANPTASVGLTAVNGVATTYLRSDGAPALSQSIVPTWTGIHTFNNKVLMLDGRFEYDAGANVAAANDLTLGTDGNLFTITGNTQINAITTANWQAGSQIAFIFTGTPTLKNNTAGGAGTATMLLAGRVDFVAAVGDYIGLQYDGTNWYETNRKLTGLLSPMVGRNGITDSVDRYILGGTLYKNTTINATSSFTFKIDGTRGISSDLMQVTNNGGGSALHVTGNGNGASLQVNYTGTLAPGFYSTTTATNGLAGSFEVNPSSTNTVTPVINIIRNTSGTPANGIGGNITFSTETSVGSNKTSNELKSLWTDVTDATRTSSLVFSGQFSAATVDLLTLAGNGSITMRPITATAASAITPAEGMLVFVSNTDATFTSIGIWSYQNAAWKAL